MSRFGKLPVFGWIYPDPEEGSSGPPPTDTYVAEDGVTIYTAEDGVTPYVPE